MVGCFLGMRIVLAGIRQYVGCARQRANLDLLHVFRTKIIFFDQVENSRDWGMGQGLSWKELHAALRDASGVAEAVGEQIQLPLWTKHVSQLFFAVDHMLRLGVPLFRQ